MMMTSLAMAQDSITDFSAGFVGDTRIDSLLRLHVMQNEKFPGMEGYRIQIYKESGNMALDSALAVRERFLARYPNVPAYISFDEPYYRIRVGDFRTRIEALRFLVRIKRRYPLAWEIKDEIQFPK
jgi:hypothetical protein